jgi:SNF2 family DNA or RNA helicase
MIRNPYARPSKRNCPWDVAESNHSAIPPSAVAPVSSSRPTPVVTATSLYILERNLQINCENVSQPQQPLYSRPMSASSNEHSRHASTPAYNVYKPATPTNIQQQQQQSPQQQQHRLQNQPTYNAYSQRHDIVSPYRDSRPHTSYRLHRNSPNHQIPLTEQTTHQNATFTYTPHSTSNILSTETIRIQKANDASNSANEDPFDDGGFDWGAVVKLVDSISEKSSPIRSESQTSHVSVQPLVTKTAPLEPAALQTRPLSSSSSVHGASATEVRPMNTSNLTASLRPESWLPDLSTPSSNAASAPTPPSDPHQAGLPKELQYDPATVQPITDEHRLFLVQHADLSLPLENGWTLFSHQKKAILRGLLMRRFILALDMGLGKTLIGCVWAKAFYKTMHTKTIVICPVSLKKEWRRTAFEATGLSLQDEKKDVPDESTNVCIVSWGKVPSSIRSAPYVVIADEAHSMQSMTASRTKDALQLMLSPNCVGVLLLSGTPMKNGKPCNLFPLLKAVKHPLGCHQKAYEAYFCGGREVNFGAGRVWQANGSAHLDQLRKLISSHMLHLTKEECLKDLPPQTRVFRDVPVSSRRQIQHQRALHELSRIYNQNNKSGDKEAVLGAVQRLRLVGSLAKVDATVELAKSILEKEPSIVIFTSFVDAAKQVHHQLNEAGWKGALLTGETPAALRQGMVDDFQMGISSVFVGTFGAGGVGLTLTAAATIILLDRPWTPGDANQAEGRLRRIGQTKPVTSIWMRAFELDRQIDNMLDQKSQTTSAVLVGGGTNDKGAMDAMKLSIFKMLQAVLPPVEEGGIQQLSILSQTSASD